MKVTTFITFLLAFSLKGFGQIVIDSAKMYQYHKTEAIMTSEGLVRDTVYVNYIRLSNNQTDTISKILSSSEHRTVTNSETKSLSKNLLIYFNGKEYCYYFDFKGNLTNLSDKTMVKITNKQFVNYLKEIFHGKGEN